MVADSNQPAPSRVFLSYARADSARVAPIAAALSALGHQLWWDAQIEGGASFAKDIVRELAAADAVVVAWSARSVDSNWVLDEASEGRRRGRLVPVTLDGTPSPIGFRQLHAIDLTRWNGRADSPEGVALARAVARVAGQNPVAPAPVAAIRPKIARRLAPWIAAAAAMVVVTLGVWLALAPRTAAARPTIAVLPFTDMSGATGAAYFAEGIAEEILDTLARDPRLKVLGRTTALALRDHAGDPGLLRGKLGVTRLLEGSVRGGGDHVKVSVHLIDTADGSEIWTQSFDRQGGDVMRIQEDIAQAVAAKIGGGLGPAPVRMASARPVPPDVYEKVLVARQLLHAGQPPLAARARELAGQAINAAPDYALAHAVRSMATTRLSDWNVGDIPHMAAFAEANREAETAIHLDPTLPQGHEALGYALVTRGAPEAAIPALRQALRLSPNDPELHLRLGQALRDSGSLSTGIKELERAMAMDPLWTFPVNLLTASYVASNDLASARSVVAKFTSISPDLQAVRILQVYLASSVGQYGDAINKAKLFLNNNDYGRYAEMNLNASLAALFAADDIPDRFRVRNDPMTRAYLRRDYESAADAMLKIGAAVWDEQPYGLALALMTLGRGGELVRAFDKRFPSATLYLQSANGDAATATLVAIAMDHVGRTADARTLRAFSRARLIRLERGGLAKAQIAGAWAVLLASEGERAAAIETLRSGIAQQWWPVCTGPEWIGQDYPFAFGALRADPRFQAVLATCRAKINEQRRIAGLGPAKLS